jgi:hypothetical protein
MQLVMLALGLVADGSAGLVGDGAEPVEDGLADGVGAGADELALADGEGAGLVGDDPRGPQLQVPLALTIRSTPGAHVTWWRFPRPGQDAAARLPPPISMARTRAVRGSACRRSRARQAGVRRCMGGSSRSLLPGTGTPLPDGHTWLGHQNSGYFRQLLMRKRLAGPGSTRSGLLGRLSGTDGYRALTRGAFRDRRHRRRRPVVEIACSAPGYAAQGHGRRMVKTRQADLL